MKANKNEQNAKKNEKIINIICIALALGCIAIFAGKRILNPVTISGSSMYPTYIEGEIVKTSKFDAETDVLEHDMVIVLNSTLDNNKQLIKRIVAVAGDQIQVIEGRLYRNGQLVQDGFPRMNSAGILEELFTVSKDHVFVLGDNRNASQDSRELGEIPIENVTAIVEEKITTKKPEGYSSREASKEAQP